MSTNARPLSPNLKARVESMNKHGIAYYPETAMQLERLELAREAGQVEHRDGGSGYWLVETKAEPQVARRGDIVDYTDGQGYTFRTVVKRVAMLGASKSVRYYGLIGVEGLVATGVVPVSIEDARPGSYSRFVNAQAVRSNLVTVPVPSRPGVIAEYDAAIAVRVAIRNADATAKANA